MVTVLFSDLKGFTPLSEKMDPQALMDWLNMYMETMAQLVMDHGGVVDDYFGDAIKADFGVPLPRKSETEIGQGAVNAVNCALAMAREMDRLNKLWQEQQLPIMGMRIGIFTGPVVAGSLGSAQRLKYTTVGDTVNIAARLESFDKEVFNPRFVNSSCRILIGETTLRYLGDQFQTERLGEATLEGKDEKITVYRVVGRLGQNTGGVIHDKGGGDKATG
jgi:adenylate cyclase